MKNAAIEQFSKHTVILAIAAFALSIGVSAQAGVLDLGGAVSQSASAPAPMKAGGSSALTPLSGRGTAALDFANTHQGVCASSPVPCGASSGDCECDIFTGQVTLPKVGKSNLTLNVTTDKNDAVRNGNGTCFAGTGQGTICNGGSCVGLQVEGFLCIGVLTGTDPSNEEVIVDANEVFYIVPSTSTGKVAGASGGGSLVISNDVKIANAKVSSNTGYATLNGTFQAKP